MKPTVINFEVILLFYLYFEKKNDMLDNDTIDNNNVYYILSLAKHDAF